MSRSTRTFSTWAQTATDVELIERGRDAFDNPLVQELCRRYEDALDRLEASENTIREQREDLERANIGDA